MNKKRDIKSGKVLKKSGLNTLSVLVSTRRQATKYKKIICQSQKYMVHYDEKDNVCTGDYVEIEHCRAYSKTKYWRFLKVVTK